MVPGTITLSARRALDAVVIALVIAGLALAGSACRVDAAQMGAAVDGDESSALPSLGPVPNFSHWHAAYLVRICDDVLEPFDSENDPLGIHSHADGLIHIHPFFEESGYDNATLGLFADAMEFELADGELTLPGGGTWRDGDLCNGEPARVFVDKWDGPDPEGTVTRHFVDLADIRYLADGELYHIGFAPVDSPPVVPPSRSQLDQVSNLAPPPEPWVDVPAVAPGNEVRVWPVARVDAGPCTGDQIPESVLFGPVRCYTPGPDILDGGQAITSARAVELGREPAVELRIGAPLRRLIDGGFPNGPNPFTFAIEVDDRVVTAPMLRLPHTSDRVVIVGGFSADAARSLADLLESAGG